MSARLPKFNPLTPKQRGYLAQLAKQAHTYLTGKGAIDEPFDAWRRREAMEASSGFTISEAPRRCFDDLEQHFLTLAGKTGKALERALGPDNDMRNLEQQISVAARTAGVHPAYVQGICKRMFGADTWSNARQAKAVLIALTNKARKNSKEAA
jgi:hypothetical protein